MTGPLLRAAGLPWDLRKTEPYLGYETYDFDVPTDDGGDCWSRFVVRVAEMRESLRIISQVVDRLEQTPGPVMVDDPKIAWPAQLSIGSDGMGNSPAHVNKIMNGSMEALIHHFKLVTEGFRVPAGQVYVPVEGPRGELGRARGLRRRHPALPGAPARAVLHQPAGRRGDVDRRPDRRRDRLGGLDRPGDGWV